MGCRIGLVMNTFNKVTLDNVTDFIEIGYMSLRSYIQSTQTILNYIFASLRERIFNFDFLLLTFHFLQLHPRCFIKRTYLQSSIEEFDSIFLSV